MTELVIRNLEVSPLDRDKEVCIEVSDTYDDRSNLIFLSIDETKKLIEFLTKQVQ